MKISLNVNQRAVHCEAEERTLLSELLREHLGLTGTHRGCDTAQCGACTVHVDGCAVKSCNVLAVQVDGSAVVTIEGISDGSGQLHPMQEAFRECHGLQCGFCTPGMVMSAICLVKESPNLNADAIKHGLEGNICRCTGYANIVKAVAMAAPVMRD